MRTLMLTFGLLFCLGSQLSQAQNFGSFSAGPCSAHANCLTLVFAETVEYQRLRDLFQFDSKGGFSTADGRFQFGCGRVLTSLFRVERACGASMMKWNSDYFPASPNVTRILPPAAGAVDQDTLIQTSILNPDDVFRLKDRLGRDSSGQINRISVTTPGNRIRGFEVQCVETQCTATLRVPNDMFFADSWD